MSKLTKKDFFQHMSDVYKEKYKDNDGYETLLEIVEAAESNSKILDELHSLTKMDKSDRLLYRYQLAVNGKEMTPRQVDQYITIISYALEHIH